jgi:spermidine synthase
VKPTETLAHATAPDGARLTLHRHDGAYMIRVDGVELMSTRRVHSEQQLAVLACTPLGATRRAAVLLGGLGFGFTLRAALPLLAPDARIVVAELLPEVVEWNLNPAWPLGSDALADHRVSLVCDDVANVLRDSPGMFDAILLDVDNGAEAFTTRGNRALYEYRGIRLAVSALRPGGLLAYWSVDVEPAFVHCHRNQGTTRGRFFISASISAISRGTRLMRSVPFSVTM